jgi:diguanylate cyclase (GGDEF)-like protein/PAS domain S-box-containing protein
MDKVFDSSNYTFSVYALPLLAMGLLSAGHGLAVLIRERASSVSLAFAATTTATAVWLLSFAAVYSTNDTSVVMAWVRVEHLGVAFIPTTVLLFTVAVTGRLRSLWPFVAGAAALSSTFYVLIVSTNWFIVDLHRYYWGFYPIYGWPIVPFIVFFGTALTASLHIYKRALTETTSDTQRKRLQAIWLALLIADLGSVDYLPAFHVPVYPFGYVFICAFMFIGTLAIWRYRLVDITTAFAANEIVETMADALLVLDRDGVIRVANGAAATVLGSSAEALIGLTGAELDAMWFDGALGGLLSPETLHRSEVSYRKPGGGTGTALIAASTVRGGSGERQATICIVHDITERKLAEEALRESEGLYRTLVETSPDAVLVAEQGGLVLMANRRAAELVGLKNPEELRGRNAMEFVAPQDQQRLSDSFEQASGSVIVRDVEYMLVTNDGALLPAELSVSRVPGAAGQFNAIMAVARDISERKRAEETIRFLAFHDALTGVANRSVLMDHLAKALAQARRQGHALGLLFLDLDNFKEINDTVGHAVGDETLREIAAELVQLVREGDTLARMGGDEFVILLAHINDIGEAVAVAERVLARSRLPRAAGARAVPVTASIGIATYPADGDDAEVLLRSADTAMYAAKRQGGNSYQMAANLNARPETSQRTAS